MEELKPCKKCKSKKVRLIYTGIIQDYPPIYWLVGCDKCGNKTDLYCEKRQAIAAWNKKRLTNIIRDLSKIQEEDYLWQIKKKELK